MARSSSGDPLDSWLSCSYRYLDLFATAARQATSLAPYAARRKLLLPLLQVLNLASPEGSRLQNGHLPSNATGISITAHNYLLNLDRHVLSIEWEIYGCGGHRLPTYEPQDALEESAQCGPLNLAVDVYLNNVSNKTFSYDPNKLPIDPQRGPIYIRELHSFWTEHELHPSARPADSYTFHAFGLAIDPATNLSVNIARFAVENSLDGFTISSRRSTKAVEGITHDTASGPTTVEMDSSALEVEIRHSKSAKALNMCIFAANWILTLATACIAGKAVTRRRVDFATVVVHCSMALTILSIRKLYIDPPPFGAFLDAVGFSSQITIVAISFVVLVHAVSRPYLSTKMSFHSLGKA